MIKMKEVRWGIIGCGNVTEVKSGPGLQKADGSELVAVMRRNVALAEDYAKRHNVKKWYGDAQALIDDPDINAVYVATPPSSHLEYVIAAAKAGKAVYVEKPMGKTYDECLQMVKACEEANVPLYVAYYRRGLSKFLKIKELLGSGVIGDIRYVTMKQHQKVRDEELKPDLPWRLISEIAGGGKFLDLASHTLDIMAYLLGEVTEVSGKGWNQGKYYEVEDIVTAHLTFDNSVQGIGVWCFTAFEDEDINEIVGNKGKLRFSTFGHEPIELVSANGLQTYEVEAPEHIQQPLIQKIVNELRGLESCPSTGRSGSKTNWVMDQILESYRENHMKYTNRSDINGFSKPFCM
jgi:predicted dehydrogenase